LIFGGIAGVYFREHGHQLLLLARVGAGAENVGDFVGFGVEKRPGY
jgi:hypothetical protein